MRNKLEKIYKKLFLAFGPQYWWPADGPFEVMVGAILTQNTNWKNVECSIDNLKEKKVLKPSRLRIISQRRLAGLIKPAGYFNIKARRLKNFLDFFFRFYKGSINRMLKNKTLILREELLGVKGIGEETADSILLYALGKPIFVVDAYTRRIFQRHGLIKENDDYARVQRFFMQHLKRNSRLFNEYHALLVKLGKEFCLKNRPRCAICPIGTFFEKRRKACVR